VKSDTIDLIPIPEEGASPSEEVGNMIEVMERTRDRLKILQEGKEARSSAEGEKALQELDLLAASVRTVQARIRDLLTEREQRIEELLSGI
jgi:hypothetical protein